MWQRPFLVRANCNRNSGSFHGVASIFRIRMRLLGTEPSYLLHVSFEAFNMSRHGAWLSFDRVIYGSVQSWASICYHAIHHAARYGKPHVASQTNRMHGALYRGAECERPRWRASAFQGRSHSFECDALRRGNRGGCPPHRC